MRRIAVTPRPIKKTPRPAVKAPEVDVGAPKKRRWWQWPVRAFFWVLDLLNLTIIFEKMIPRKDPVTGKRHRATFLLWIFGIYSAMYGIASARYESALDRLEVRASILTNAIFNKESRALACSQVGILQREEIRIPPDFIHPWVTWRSFWGAKAVDEGIVKLLKDTVVSVKNELQEADLVDADLSGAHLDQANLSGANLTRANLNAASLTMANLRGADLSETQLNAAHLAGANLQFTALPQASLIRADMSRADLSQAVLLKANLTDAYLADTWLHLADLSLANLRGADLHGAYLVGVRNYRTITNIHGANIYGVDFAPEGFREWAIANGACEVVWWDWRINGCPPQQSTASNE